MDREILDWSVIRSHLKMGGKVCVSDSVDRENETDWAIIGRPPTAKDIDELIRIGSGVFVAYLPQQFFDRLGLMPSDEFVLGTVNAPEVMRTLAQPINPIQDPNFVVDICLRTQRDEPNSPLEIAATCQALFNLFIDSELMTEEELKVKFVEQFTYGNVRLIAGVREGLVERQGHTEMLLAMARGLNLPEIAFACELIDIATLESMRPAAAVVFATEHNSPLVQLTDILTLQGRT